MFTRTLAVALAMGAAACATTGGGRLEVDRFSHNLHPYAVLYANGGTPKFPLGESWRVDNFTIPEQAKRRRGRAPTRSAPQPKHGRGYETVRSYDPRDTGTDTFKRKEQIYDLSLEHTRRDASMWVQTFAISTHDLRKDLDVFASRFVESSAGADMVAVRFGVNGPVGAVEKRFASRVLSGTSCELSGREAYRLDFEVANVDQLQLQGEVRTTRGSLVFVRTGYDEQVSWNSEPFPVLMVIGIATRPKDYAALQADFDTLLSQTVLGQRDAGLPSQSKHTCRSEHAGVANTSAQARPAAMTPVTTESVPAEPAGAPALPAVGATTP